MAIRKERKTKSYNMAIIPIFIHVHEKSSKELREEMKRDYRMWKAEQEDLARQREREYQEKERKRREKLEREERIRKEVEEEMRKNPWDFQILPEGWDMLGQRYVPLITEYEPSGYDD